MNTGSQKHGSQTQKNVLEKTEQLSPPVAPCSSCRGAAHPGGHGAPALSWELSVCTQLKVKGRTWPKHGETFPPTCNTQLLGRKLHSSP